MRKKLLRLTAVGVLVLVGQALFFHTTRGQLLAVAVRGNSQCPLGLTMGVGDYLDAFHKTFERIQRSNRLLKTDGDFELYDTPRGQFWMAKGGAWLISWVLAEQEHEIYGKGARAVQKGDIVLDCGADIGTFTRTALSHGARMVVSIDPDQFKAACLRRNFAAEITAGKVVVIPKGVWDKQDRLRMKGDTVVGAGTAGTVEVELTTIDRIVADLGLPEVSFIKMDVEGAEKPALQGARETLKKFHPRLSIATEHYPDDAVAIPRLVRSIVPNYTVECGPCEMAEGRVRPQAIYLF